MKHKFVYIIALLLTIETLCFTELSKQDDAAISALTRQNATLTATVDKLTAQNTTLQAAQAKMRQYKAEADKLSTEKTDRSGERGRVMEVTAYWEGSCGKEPSDPLYGITASGKYVQEGFIAAWTKEYPIGTRLYDDHKECPWKTIYTETASFTAQQWALRSMSYRMYCIGRGMGKWYKQYKHDPERYLKDGHKKYSQWVAMENFEKQFPEIAARYFDVQYSDLKKKLSLQ